MLRGVGLRPRLPDRRALGARRIRAEDCVAARYGRPGMRATRHTPGTGARTRSRAARDCRAASGPAASRSGSRLWIAARTHVSRPPRRTGCAPPSPYPLRLAGELVGVVEFLSANLTPENPAMLAMGEAIVARLADALARLRAQEALARSQPRAGASRPRADGRAGARGRRSRRRADRDRPPALQRGRVPRPGHGRSHRRASAPSPPALRGAPGSTPSAVG